METKKINISNALLEVKELSHLIKQRTMSAEEWIAIHASGTLRKNNAIGMVWKQQYLHERVAYQYGFEFNIAPKSRVLTGEALTEGDNHSVTEAGWHIERYMTLNLFQEESLKCVYLNVESSENEIHEGIGIVFETTTAQWIPEGYVVYSIVAEYSKKDQAFLPANNPF